MYIHVRAEANNAELTRTKHVRKESRALVVASIRSKSWAGLTSCMQHEREWTTHEGAPSSANAMRVE